MKTKINGNTALGRALNRALELGRAATAAAEDYAAARSVAVVAIAQGGIALRRGDALLLAGGEVSGRDKVTVTAHSGEVEHALSTAGISVADAIDRGLIKVDVTALRRHIAAGSLGNVTITEEREIGTPVFTPLAVADDKPKTKVA